MCMYVGGFMCAREAERDIETVSHCDSRTPRKLKRNALDEEKPERVRRRYLHVSVERLLTFVNADAKQPEKSLLDLINTDAIY